ncbi:MAG: gliding motility protein GldL [Paraprevotella sp.]|nr:gliding motility protein GldL [Paraprevotella sp.]
MANNNKNIIVRIQNWIESVAGQTFLNYAYSWGAAIVILGALFKLTHIPGANAMLFIGMGTEVLVFFISGFDRPAELKNKKSGTQAVEVAGSDEPLEQGAQTVIPQGVVQTGAPIIIGNVGGGVAQPVGTVANEGNVKVAAAVASQPVASQPNVTSQPAVDMKLLADMINASNAEFLESARQACTPGMTEAAEAYVEELKVLTETLSRVSEQAESMTKDSKEMENLNRTLTGINTIYEMQLKSISTQVGTIDQINEQTRKMARQIEDLNAIYDRMIKALTINMKQTPSSL